MERFDRLDDKLIDFIGQQHLFFVGTACAEGSINVSPKGLDTLRIMGPNRLIWLNLTGSGNETSAHVQEDGRMTIMFCSFDKQPLILRLYGHARVIHESDPDWTNLLGEFKHQDPGSRQVFDMQIDLVQTSCGYAVPYFDFTGERETLTNWSNKKGHDGITQYWTENNTQTIDGKPIKIP